MASTVRNTLMRVWSTFRKNREIDKPYEDASWYSSDSGVFVVSDGVTRTRLLDGTYPTPSPAQAAASIVVNALASLVNLESCAENPRHAMIQAMVISNDRIHNYAADNLGAIDYRVNDFPGAVATSLVISNGTATFAHIGDCILIRLPQNSIDRAERLTVDQTANAWQWLAGQGDLPVGDLLVYARKN